MRKAIRGPKAFKKYKYIREGMVMRESREKTGLTQAEVAIRLGYSSAQFISNSERGLCRFPFKKFKHLSRIYGKSAIRRVVEVRVDEFRDRLQKGI